MRTARDMWGDILWGIFCLFAAYVIYVCAACLWGP